MEELNEYKEMVGEIVHRQNDCWYDTKTLANAVYAILRYLTADRKTENSSEKPNNYEDEPQTDCDTCKHKGEYAYCRLCGMPGENNYEPQTNLALPSDSEAHKYNTRMAVEEEWLKS